MSISHLGLLWKLSSLYTEVPLRLPPGFRVHSLGNSAGESLESMSKTQGFNHDFLGRNFRNPDELIELSLISALHSGLASSTFHGTSSLVPGDRLGPLEKYGG